MVRKILPQALIHLASTKTCVTWNEKTPCTNTKTSSNSHTQKRQGEVKSPHPYFVIQIQQKQIAYSASCLRTAIRRFTLHNPTKTKKQLFRHEKITMREHKALNKLLQRIASNQFHAKLPLNTHTQTECSSSQLACLSNMSMAVRCPSHMNASPPHLDTLAQAVTAEESAWSTIIR